MNDEILEDYFMLFGKHKDRIIIEIPVEVAEPKATTADTRKASYASLYFFGQCIHMYIVVITLKLL